MVGFQLAKAEWCQKQSREVGLLVSRLWGQHGVALATLRALVGIHLQHEAVTPLCFTAKSQGQTRAHWPHFPGRELGKDLCSLT